MYLFPVARSAFGGNATSVNNHVGNPMQAQDLAAVLPGNDVVLSALGTRGLGTTSVLIDSVRATIEAMRWTGLRRLVIVSSLLLDLNIGWFPQFLGRTFLRHHAQDQRAMEKEVTTSGLDWTVLRASRLNNRGLTGRYIVSAEGEPAKASGEAMSREDLASMMLDTAERGNHVQQIVRVCGGRR
jgi:putative NADH-flavin reductase